MKEVPPGKVSEVNLTAQKQLKFRIVALSLSFGTYFGIYAFLSSHGSYIGENRGGSDNRNTWYPRYCGEIFQSPSGRQRVRITAVGWFFLPPMLLDQTLIHYTDSDSE